MNIFKRLGLKNHVTYLVFKIILSIILYLLFTNSERLVKTYL